MPRTSAARQKDEPPRTYLLKITLMETDPPIWRRLVVPGDTTLAGLDRIIQAAMGWTNSHLHTFTVGGVLYAEPSPEWEVEVEVRDERRVRLADVAREEGEAFLYEYDLGDSWRHQVLVEQVIAGGADEAGRPRCLGGEMACPPEDSGGVRGLLRHAPHSPRSRRRRVREHESLGRVHDRWSLRPRRVRPRGGERGHRSASRPPSPRLTISIPGRPSSATTSTQRSASRSSAGSRGGRPRASCACSVPAGTRKRATCSR
jgi:hypothetical protein